MLFKLVLDLIYELFSGIVVAVSGEWVCRKINKNEAQAFGVYRKLRKSFEWKSINEKISEIVLMFVYAMLSRCGAVLDWTI